MRILLIEDDEDVARLITTGMGEAKHDVTHASTGGDGMSRALAETFDVIILDRQLPDGLDGVMLLKILREQRIFTPALFLSGLGGLPAWIQGLDAGGDDYMVKPFVFTNLLSRVEALHRAFDQQANK